jgi:hypothetical protein
MAETIPRSDEEKRQAVLFAARYRYQAQRFVLAGTETPWDGDPFDLPQGVEPLMSPRDRWEVWRNALPREWSDAQVDSYQLKHWCGGFALACLHDAGLALDTFWKDGVGFCEPKRLTKVRVPEPGDIAWFVKNAHYCLVERVRGNLFDSIDGNQGLTPARPSIKLHTGRALSSVAVFYSIKPFLESAA